jgi:transposase InsO family protein
MSVKTSSAERQQFYGQHQAGATYGEIATRFGVSVGCVRYWCRRQRDGGSTTSRAQRGACGLLRRFDVRVRYAILRLRLEHPHWGPGRLRFNLERRRSLCGLRLPQAAQVGRYLHQWPRFRRRHKPSRLPVERLYQPTAVHQRWQVDFKLGIPLADGSQVNLTTIRDPVGEVCIAAQLTPAGQVGHPPSRVTIRQLQAALRLGFAQWHTLPYEVQTDHEAVCVGQAREAFPGLFTLWLIGLGIQPLLIRPGTPTDNAEVERCHQTLYNYALLGPAADTLPHLRQTLQRAVQELAYDLPSQAAGCHGRPPITAHPELLHPPRPFAPEQELALFDLRRVDTYLANFLWQRTVGTTGEIALGDKRYTVRAAYAHCQVLVCLDPTQRQFVVFEATPPYREIRSRPARGLDVADLTGITTYTGHAVPQQLPLPLVWLEG